MDWSLKQVMDELVQRVLDGPMQFRFVLQPAMAASLGIRDGLADFRAGVPAILPALLTRAGDRASLWKMLLRRLRWSIFAATAIDAAVQYVMFRHIRPLSALIVGSALMALPYCIARGLSNGIRSRRGRPRRLRPV
jgi:hypothetical protein